MPEKQGPKALTEHDLEGLDGLLDAIGARQRQPGICDGCGAEELIFPTCPDCTVDRLTGESGGGDHAA